MTAHMEVVSAGGVAYRREERSIEIALVAIGSEKRWQLPKGLIDPGETAEQAALREVGEEAGIECRLIEKIDTVDYWFTASFDGPSTRYHKHVHFFLMEYVSGDVADHDDEVTDAQWFDINEASRLFAFESEKKVVEKAFELLCA